MKSTIIIDINELNDKLPNEYYYICFSSFEERCKTIAHSLSVSKIIKPYVIRNTDPFMNEKNKDNYFEIINTLPNCETIELNLNRPIETANAFNKLVSSLIKENAKNLVVDITAFTHETLLIMIKFLSAHTEAFSSILFIYNNAKDYSEWLSKGCKEVRNVVGYPGIFNPSQKNHLLLLTGFEKERATKLVELLEPDVISLGNGVEPTNDNHSNTMEDIQNEFEQWSKSLQGVRINAFDFSCKDINNTVKALKRIINDNPNDNYILIPLNTKLSTVSAALVATENNKIQMCYPIPETYNLEYSTPGNMVTLFDYKNFVIQ